MSREIGVCSGRCKQSKLPDVDSKSHAIFDQQHTDVRQHRCILLVVLRVTRQIVLLGRPGEARWQGLQKYEFRRDDEINELIGSVGCWCCDSRCCWLCYVSYLSRVDYSVQSVSSLSYEFVQWLKFSRFLQMSGNLAFVISSPRD
jgi:hypothetical protein